MNPAEESEFWDDIARDSTRINANVYGDLNLEECLTAIEPQLPFADNSYVLDLGCGVGRLMIPLALKYPKVTFYGWDISQAMIDAAWQGEIPPNAYFVHGDGRALVSPMGKGYRYTASAESYDAAYSMTMFQHIPPEAQQRYLEELHRVVKPGGKFCLQFVFEGEEGPMSYPVSVKDFLAWGDAAGWRETDVTLGRINPGWAWVTLLRP